MLEGELRAQNRGQYLHAPHAGQFARLPDWLASHGDKLRSELAQHTPSNLMLFGEWCAARHSLDYDHLPDWFLLLPSTGVVAVLSGTVWTGIMRS